MIKSIHINTITSFRSSILFDLTALVFIYMIPTLSHLIQAPLYYIEPMRLMLMLALVHTHRNNAYILALTLPLFSFLISAHPVFPKMLLIMLELTANVWIFYALQKVFRSSFAAIILSIISSKVLYYLIKYILIEVMIIDSGLISTPLWIQGATTILFSLYVGWQISRKMRSEYSKEL